MASGWQDGDNMTAFRRNREWISRFALNLPIYDVDNSGAQKVDCNPLKFPIGPAYPQHYQAPATVTLGFAHRMIFTNNDAAAHDAFLVIPPSAWSADATKVGARVRHLQ